MEDPAGHGSGAGAGLRARESGEKIAEGAGAVTRPERASRAVSVRNACRLRVDDTPVFRNEVLWRSADEEGP